MSFYTGGHAISIRSFKQPSSKTANPIIEPTTCNVVIIHAHYQRYIIYLWIVKYFTLNTRYILHVTSVPWPIMRLKSLSSSMSVQQLQINSKKYQKEHCWFSEGNPTIARQKDQGLYLLSGRTSYRKISSRSLEAARFIFGPFQSL